MIEWMYVAGALLLIIVGRTVPLAVEEIQLDVQKRRARRDPIDWDPSHNLKIPMWQADPRHEYTFNEVSADLLNTQTELYYEREQSQFLREQLQLALVDLGKQTMLKRRYWRALKRAGLR